MDLTVNEIQEDIAGYKDRLYLAKINLDNLPAGRLPFKDHIKRRKTQRDCQGEIKHCETLISYALEGIELCH